MDDLDKSAKDSQIISDAAVRNIRDNANKLEVKGTGYCLFCGAKMKDIRRRWCSAECRDDWEKDKKHMF